MNRFCSYSINSRRSVRSCSVISSVIVYVHLMMWLHLSHPTMDGPPRAAFCMYRNLLMDLEVAKSLAIRAGEILLHHYDRPNVSWKEHDNPVTEADRHASAFLVKELKGMFPEDGILSEEEPDDTSRLSKSRVWIIDPLDGTKEFIGHVAEFAVMIGL